MITKNNERVSGKNVVEIFYNHAERGRDHVLVHYKKDGKFVTKSWREMKDLIVNMSQYLIKKGIKKNDKIAVFSINRYEWWIADMASLSIGAVVVPVYPTNSFEETDYILTNSETVFCFAGSAEQADIISKIQVKNKKLKECVVFDEIKKNKNKKLTHIVDALAVGAAQKKEKKVLKLATEIKSSDIATIVYTSGTTGNPKGVVLSHSNIYSNVMQLMDVFGGTVDQSEVFLSFLPLSHALERVAGYYTPIAIACSVAFADSIRTILSDMQEVSPTVIVSVPRLYEKMHSGVQGEAKHFSFIKKLFFKMAFSIGVENIPNVCSSTVPTGFFAKKLQYAEAIVLSKIKKALGIERLKVAISGGGPLAISDMNFFLSLGINIYEGYGLTETSPVVCVNRPGGIRPGTVGPAMIDTDLKLSDEGEVLIKGPQVMMGYYKNKQATSEVFGAKGYLKTGDLGVIDEEGFLMITGRIKDIIVTAGGKNISPQNIENKLKESPFIEQIAIIGDKRKYLVALIVPNKAHIEVWAKNNGVLFSSLQDLYAMDRVVELFANELDRLTSSFARVEQIKKFKIINNEWSQAGGELTALQKIKRKSIEEKYKTDIEELYSKEL